jgi:hypothetical protein
MATRTNRSPAHSAATAQHGTPPSLIALIHGTFGGPPDLDPASSPAWNDLMQARRIITADEDALVTPWCDGAPAPNRLGTDRRIAPAGHAMTVALNPPGDPRGELVAAFWRVLVEYYLRRWVTAAIWVGFNVEQLSRLQRVGARSHPLRHPTCVPAERIPYRQSLTELGEDPPHASFLTLLSREPRQIETFAALGSELGSVVNGDRF